MAKTFDLGQEIFLSVSRVYPGKIVRLPSSLSGERAPNGGVYSDYGVEFVDDNQFIGRTVESYFGSYIFATEAEAYESRVGMAAAGVEMELDDMKKNMAHLGDLKAVEGRLLETVEVLEGAVKGLRRLLTGCEE